MTFEEVKHLGEQLVGIAVWTVDGKPNSFSNWEASSKERLEFRKDARDACIDMIENTKCKPLKVLAEKVYRYLLQADLVGVKKAKELKKPVFDLEEVVVPY